MKLILWTGWWYRQSWNTISQLQGNHLNMSVFIWYLVKSDLSSIRYCTRVHWIFFFFSGYQNNTAMFNWFIQFSNQIKPLIKGLLTNIPKLQSLCFLKRLPPGTPSNNLKLRLHPDDFFLGGGERLRFYKLIWALSPQTPVNGRK